MDCFAKTGARRVIVNEMLNSPRVLNPWRVVTQTMAVKLRIEHANKNRCHRLKRWHLLKDHSAETLGKKKNLARAVIKKIMSIKQITVQTNAPAAYTDFSYVLWYSGDC